MIRRKYSRIFFTTDRNYNLAQAYEDWKEIKGLTEQKGRNLRREFMNKVFQVGLDNLAEQFNKMRIYKAKKHLGVETK